jgi:hypothetical protein
MAEESGAGAVPYTGPRGREPPAGREPRCAGAGPRYGVRPAIAGVRRRTPREIRYPIRMTSSAAAMPAPTTGAAPHARTVPDSSANLYVTMAPPTGAYLDERNAPVRSSTKS